MEEKTIKITKRNDEELIFNISRITKTICRMFETLSDWDVLINNILENAKIAFYTALHSIWHCIAHGFLPRRRKERKLRHIHHEFIMAAVLIPSVHTTTTVAFSSLAILIRKVYLQRTQDKGSDDSSSIGYFNYIALPTI